MTPDMRWLGTAAILALAEVQAATDRFNRGELNVFEALELIAAAVEVYLTRQTGRAEAA